jgi:hypothetical protein
MNVKMEEWESMLESDKCLGWNHRVNNMRPLEPKASKRDFGKIIVLHSRHLYHHKKPTISQIKEEPK